SNYYYLLDLLLPCVQRLRQLLDDFAPHQRPLPAVKVMVIRTSIEPHNLPNAIPVEKIRVNWGNPKEIYSREYRPRGSAVQGRGPRMHMRGIGRARKWDGALYYHFNEL